MSNAFIALIILAVLLLLVIVAMRFALFSEAPVIEDAQSGDDESSATGNLSSVPAVEDAKVDANKDAKEAINTFVQRLSALKNADDQRMLPSADVHLSQKKAQEFDCQLTECRKVLSEADPRYKPLVVRLESLGQSFLRYDAHGDGYCVSRKDIESVETEFLQEWDKVTDQHIETFDQKHHCNPLDN